MLHSMHSTHASENFAVSQYGLCIDTGGAYNQQAEARLGCRQEAAEYLVGILE